MQFQITHIVFDCTCDDEDWTDYDAVETADFLASRYVGQIWEADDEADLIEEISCASGWCINEIDYRIILD